VAQRLNLCEAKRRLAIEPEISDHASIIDDCRPRRTRKSQQPGDIAVALIQRA
jgi:hypothetical protein